MTLQQYRPRDGVFTAALWDCSEATREDVRLLAGLAGSRVDFEPVGDGLCATFKLPEGKRRFPVPGVIFLRHRDKALLFQRPGVFAANFEPATPRTEDEIRAMFEAWGLGDLLLPREQVAAARVAALAATLIDLPPHRPFVDCGDGKMRMAPENVSRETGSSGPPER